MAANQKIEPKRMPSQSESRQAMGRTDSEDASDLDFVGDGAESSFEDADDADDECDEVESDALAVQQPLTTVPCLWPSLFSTRPPVLRFVYSGDNEQLEELPSHLKVGLKWKMQSTTPQLVKKMIAGSGFSVTTKAGWVGTWGKHMKAVSFRNLRADQKINHYPGSFQLGRKDRMWKNVAHMQARHGRKAFDFLPETFCLPNDLQLLQRAWMQEGSKGKWILKPNASARGIGIKVIHQWSQVPKKKSVIVQRYLAHPLLIDGAKFDLRIYAYVTSFDPLRVYICKEGLARFATQKYSNKKSSLKNRYMHLTNYSVNKNSGEFVQNSDVDQCVGHKWGLRALWRRLQDDGIDTDVIWDKISAIVIKTLVAVEATINSGVKWNCKQRSVCHELFGFDIMLESNLKPYLIEVNISPSMASSSPLDKAIKGRLLRDVFNLAGFLPPACRFPGPENEDYMLHEKGTRNFSGQINQKERLKHAYYVQHHDELASDKRLSDILDTLTDDDICMLMETEEENARRGDLERLLPSVKYSPLLKYTQTQRYYNVLLHQWQLRYEATAARGVDFLKQVSDDALARFQSQTTASEKQFYNAPTKPRVRTVLPELSNADADDSPCADADVMSADEEDFDADFVDGIKGRDNEQEELIRVLTAPRVGEGMIEDDEEFGQEASSADTSCSEDCSEGGCDVGLVSTALRHMSIPQQPSASASATTSAASADGVHVSEPRPQLAHLQRTQRMWKAPPRPPPHPTATSSSAVSRESASASLRARRVQSSSASADTHRTATVLRRTSSGSRLRLDLMASLQGQHARQYGADEGYTRSYGSTASTTSTSASTSASGPRVRSAASVTPRRPSLRQQRASSAQRTQSRPGRTIAASVVTLGSQLPPSLSHNPRT